MSRERSLEEYRELCEEVEESFRHSARKEGRTYRVVCPRCTSSKTGRSDYSMSVTGDGRFYCHRCNVGGKLREAPDPSAAVEVEPEAPAFIEPPEGYIPLGYEPGYSAASLEDARAYALKRHLTPELWRVLEVGAVLDGYYSGRIILPVLDEDREWRGFVARDWTKRAEKPYLYNKGFSRARFWNHAAAAEETDEPLLVVEGVLDAVPYWPDAVAMLGKLSEEQKAALCAATRPIALVFDGDAHVEGHATALQLQLVGVRAGAVRLPPKVDPDQVDFSLLRDVARRCIGLMHPVIFNG